MADRPLEALRKAEGSVILVHMRSGQEVRGRLLTCDDYMNLSLEDAELLKEGAEPQKIGATHVKGDNLVFVALRPSG